MASPAIESRLGERRSGMPDPKPIAVVCCISAHRIEVCSQAQMQRAFTIILRMTQGPVLPDLTWPRALESHIRTTAERCARL